MILFQIRFPSLPPAWQCVLRGGVRRWVLIMRPMMLMVIIMRPMLLMMIIMMSTMLMMIMVPFKVIPGRCTVMMMVRSQRRGESKLGLDIVLQVAVSPICQNYLVTNFQSCCR